MTKIAALVIHGKHFKNTLLLPNQKADLLYGKVNEVFQCILMGTILKIDFLNYCWSQSYLILTKSGKNITIDKYLN